MCRGVIIADIIRDTTPFYIVDFTDSDVDVADISSKATLIIVWGEFNFFEPPA